MDLLGQSSLRHTCISMPKHNKVKEDATHHFATRRRNQFVPLAVAFKVDPGGLPTFMKVLAVISDLIVLLQPWFYCNLAIIKEGCICVKRDEIWEEYEATALYSDLFFAIPLTSICIFAGGGGV